jgi:hypothetical protein
VRVEPAHQAATDATPSHRKDCKPSRIDIVVSTLRYSLKRMIFKKYVAEFDAYLQGARGSVNDLSVGSRDVAKPFGPTGEVKCPFQRKLNP